MTTIINFKSFGRRLEGIDHLVRGLGPRTQLLNRIDHIHALPSPATSRLISPMTSCAWGRIKTRHQRSSRASTDSCLQDPQSTLTTDLIPRDMWYVGGCSAKIPIAVCRHWSRRGGCSTEGGGEGRSTTEFWALL